MLVELSDVGLVVVLGLGFSFSFSLFSGGLVELLVVAGAGGFVAVLILFPLEVLVVLEVVATDGLFAELVGLLFVVLVGCFGAVVVVVASFLTVVCGFTSVLVFTPLDVD